MTRARLTRDDSFVTTRGCTEFPIRASRCARLREGKFLLILVIGPDDNCDKEIPRVNDFSPDKSLARQLPAKCLLFLIADSLINPTEVGAEAEADEDDIGTNDGGAGNSGTFIDTFAHTDMTNNQDLSKK